MKKREDEKVASVEGFSGNGKTILLIEVGKNLVQSIYMNGKDSAREGARP